MQRYTASLRLVILLSHIPNKRQSIARALASLGATSVLEHISLARQPVLMVFTYHRISDPAADPFYEPVISASAELFREQLAWLANRFRLLALDELLAYLEGGLTWREPVVLLTFDDGYRDNFDTAVPILRERQAPATFFIPTSFTEARQIPWWDLVAYVIKHTHVSQFVLHRDPEGKKAPLVIDLTTSSRAAAIYAIVDALLNGTVSHESWFLKQLVLQGEIEANPESLACTLFMSWDQIRQLIALDSNLSVGSHTCNHPRLATLDDKTQWYELSESKRVLEAQLGRKITALAYPYGWTGTYDHTTKRLAAEAGYRVSFTARAGLNQIHEVDRYEVNRLGVGFTDSVPVLRARVVLYAMCGHSVL
jgi:peptidoglycan/xylan/chitin deacetylase (PgdA/CDA1 family)